MYLASAILRTITELLESKARMGEPSIVSAQVQPRQAVQEVKELDIHNVVKLENIDGNDEKESSNQENSDQEIDEKKLKKQEDKLCHDTDKEPGEISSMNSRNSQPGKQVQKTFPLAPFKKSDTNLTAEETPKKRLLSDWEQNYIKSSLSKWHQLYCQILPRGETFPCQFCSYTTKGNNQRKDLRKHQNDVHFICKLCGEDQKSCQDLMMHLKSTHVKGSNYLVWNRWVREKIKIYYNALCAFCKVR